MSKAIRGLRERIGLAIIVRSMDRPDWVFRLGVWLEDMRCPVCGTKNYYGTCNDCRVRP